EVTFPHLYDSLPCSVSVSPYHATKNVYIYADTPDLQVFYFDPLIPFLDENPLDNNIPSDVYCYHPHRLRAQDVPSVKNWHSEHCPPNWPVKVWVLYQKLKCYVLNELKSRPEKAMTKTNFFQQLKATNFFQTTRLIRKNKICQ
ncbi:hypothetical protein DFH94DRAFT_633898, partial [Russula ochroleuca]